MPKRIMSRGKRVKSRPHIFSTPSYLGERHFPTQTELIQYDELGFDDLRTEMDSKAKALFGTDKNHWLLIKGLSNEVFINDVCRSIGLHGFDIRDLLSDQQVIKATVYENIVFIVFHTFRLKENSHLEEIKLAFALGENFLISFQENEDSIFAEVKQAIEDNALQIRNKPISFLLYVLLNAVNAINLNTILQMENELIEIEELLISKQDTTNIQQLLHLRRMSYIQMKRAVVSLREEFGNLTQGKSDLIRGEDLVYFNNFDDRLRSLYGSLESYHESLISLSDIYYNNNSLLMNNIIKRLTVVSTIFIPLTFLVGVWGMNFKSMPETEWKYGYLMAWICLFVVGIGTFIFMKSKKWF